MRSILEQGPSPLPGQSERDDRSHTRFVRWTVALVTVSSLFAVWAIFSVDKQPFWEFSDYYLALVAVPLVAGVLWYVFAFTRGLPHGRALSVATSGALAHGVWAAIPAGIMILLPVLATLIDTVGVAVGLIALAILLLAPVAALFMTFRMVGTIAQILPPSPR